MLSLVRRFSRSLARRVWCSLLVPSAAYAQAAITGVVKDASGGVLPGVTVEAASPVLIEKVRSVVTDATGQYRIVDLRPGTYSVTFSLPGFSTVKREGIELSGTFVATVNADLKVGALEETITVTGETPIVDVQSARTQQIDQQGRPRRRFPSSRNVGGIQAMIPGMSTTGDSGGITGRCRAGPPAIHGGRANDSRIYADGINMGWAGDGGGGGSMPQVAASQEVVMTISGGLAEAETSGVIFNVVPREGSNTFSGQFNYSGSNGALQGSNYTQALKDAGLRAPFELINVYDVNGDGRRPDHARQAVVLWRLPPDRRGADGAGHVVRTRTPATRTAWVGGLRQVQAGVHQQPGATGDHDGSRGRRRRATSSTSTGPSSSTTPTTTPAEAPRRRRRKRRAECSTSRRVNPVPAGSRRSRASCWSRPAGACIRRGTASDLRNDGTFNTAMIQRLEQVGEPGCAARQDCIPGLLSRMPRAPGQGGFTQSLIGTLASLRASADVRHRRAQHEVRLPGRVQQPVADLQELHPGHPGPDELRRAEPADADHLGGADRHEVHPQSHPDEFLRAGPVDAQPADAAGRRAVRLS